MFLLCAKQPLFVYRMSTSPDLSDLSDCESDTEPVHSASGGDDDVDARETSTRRTPGRTPVGMPPRTPPVSAVTQRVSDSPATRQQAGAAEGYRGGAVSNSEFAELKETMMEIKDLLANLVSAVLTQHQSSPDPSSSSDTTPRRPPPKANSQDVHRLRVRLLLHMLHVLLGLFYVTVLL